MIPLFIYTIHFIVDTHTIDGRTVEAKKAVPKDEQTRHDSYAHTNSPARGTSNLSSNISVAKGNNIGGGSGGMTSGLSYYATLQQQHSGLHQSHHHPGLHPSVYERHHHTQHMSREAAQIAAAQAAAQHAIKCRKIFVGGLAPSTREGIYILIT